MFAPPLFRVEVTHVLGSDVVERAPIPQEGVRGPSPGNLDDIRGNAGDQQFSGPTDPEAVACGTWVPQRVPNLVASLEKNRFG
jgi:hypothetical protein